MDITGPLSVRANAFSIASLMSGPFSDSVFNSLGYPGPSGQYGADCLVEWGNCGYPPGMKSMEGKQKSRICQQNILFLKYIFFGNIIMTSKMNLVSYFQWFFSSLSFKCGDRETVLWFCEVRISRCDIENSRWQFRKLCQTFPRLGLLKRWSDVQNRWLVLGELTWR